MGISSNQARFLALTSRQVDLENRVQQICQRRLRLSSELEKVATDYNNQIGNRKMFTYNTSNSGISQLSLTGIEALKDTNGNTYKVVTMNSDAAEYANMVWVPGSGFDPYINGDGPANLVTLTQLGLPASASEAEALEAAIRSGAVSIATKSDAFTQSAVAVRDKDNDLGNYLGNYELRDWRTLPDIADELYKGDDVAAENKYDRTIAQVNAQDKKLQLEQSSIEVEYKAVTSEKEAVKKILDTNASSSFKYFS